MNKKPYYISPPPTVKKKGEDSKWYQTAATAGRKSYTGTQSSAVFDSHILTEIPSLFVHNYLQCPCFNVAIA